MSVRDQYFEQARKQLQEDIAAELRIIPWKTYIEIAAKFGTSTPTVTAVAKAYGLTRPRGRRKRILVIAQ